MPHRVVNKPTSRADYVQVLIKAWKQEWEERYNMKKSDIYEYSLKSLKEFAKKIKHDNLVEIFNMNEVE